jgi:molybdopterin converting factor small subunit
VDVLDEDVFMEAGLSGDALATYDSLLTKLVEARSQGALEAEVELLFDRCDYSLLQLATSRRDTGLDAAEKEALAAVVDAVNAMAARRLESAVARLGSVLRAGNPVKIMEKMTEIAAKDEIDVQLLELIEVNKQQAQAAGPAGANAVELMSVII